MKLHWSPRSPFVRKVMIVLHETGLIDRVECVRTVVAFASPPSDEILQDNPLGKIPALVLDDGQCLFDSRVICEYLDDLAAGGLLHASGPERIAQLRRQAFADGLTDVLLLMRTEYMRAAPDAGILEGFRRKVVASLHQLEREAADFSADQFTLGDVALVCAISQLEFRYAGSNWRAAFPALAAWFDKVSQRPSVSATAVVDDATPTAKDTHSLIDFFTD